MKKRIIAFIVASTMLFTACSGTVKESTSSLEQDDDGIEETKETEEPKITEATTMSTTASETTSETDTTNSIEGLTLNGEYVVFGHYEQDGDLNNGPESIEWEIVSESEGRMLLISRYVLDAQPYNYDYCEITWEDCSLRAWLNGEFYDAAFSDDEKNMILMTSLSNRDNPLYDTPGGNETSDRVFCLSVEEVFEYYEFDGYDEYLQRNCSDALRSEPTYYASRQGEDSFCWWLRSPGQSGCVACDVYYTCTDWDFGMDVNCSERGVRPAICIKRPVAY